MADPTLDKPGKPCCTAGRGTSPAAPAQPGEPKIADTMDATSMTRLPGGAFLMGADDEQGLIADGEGPVREIELDPFLIGVTAVSNADFAAFVDATGYVTEAEHFGWSFVFYGLLAQSVLDTHPQVAAAAPWWCAVAGAHWRAPEGPGSRLDARMDHPVVHVSWNDAAAYAAWAGKRLPSEAEWEYAARGGLVQQRYPWGDELTPGGEHRCNIWQGRFPEYNSLADGYLGTAPARSFEPNGYGLYNMVGNVWEWCRDWFARERTPERRNPGGPASGTARVMRGGSFLCHASYCNRYRVAARYCNTPDSTASNIGFRCVADIQP
ncbi:formylglycine-generating enzyme family protein [Rhodanobacter geophilus]|uniref:Formylglycine-generating enzyme family protein n=1 Tax=Rhodanobacter geophilus TaxID=3162488 RepID=A0ABV3QSF1_9GAMM